MANEVAEIERRINKDIVGGMRLGSGASGISFGSASEAMEFAKLMSVSGAAVPVHCRKEPGVCLGIVDDAIRFGISPYALARKSYLVNGTISYEAQVVAAIVLTRGPLKHRPTLIFKGEGANRQCFITAELLDGTKIDPPYESPKFGTISPKNSPLWKTDPDQQLSYYSLRAFGRRYFPDVLLGVYDFEEAMTFKDITPPKTLAESLSGPKGDGFNHAEATAVIEQSDLTASEAEDLREVRMTIAGIHTLEDLETYRSMLAPAADRASIALKGAIGRAFNEWKEPK